MFISDLASIQSMCKYAEEDSSVTGRVAAGAGGVLGLRMGLPRLLGARLLYHGTGSANKQRILQEGLQPSMGGSSGGASMSLANIDGGSAEAFAKQSRGKVHVTEFKPYARFFENFASGELPSRMERRLERIGGERNFKNLTTMQKVKEAVGHVGDFAGSLIRSKGGVLSMPMSEVEYDKTFNFVRDMDGAPAFPGRTMAATTTDAIPSSLIRGGKDFSWGERLGRIVKDLPASIANNPKRFLAGAGLSALGLAGVNYAIDG